MRKPKAKKSSKSSNTSDTKQKCKITTTNPKTEQKPTSNPHKPQAPVVISPTDQEPHSKNNFSLGLHTSYVLNMVKPKLI